MNFWWEFLDLFFLVLHLGLVFFNLFGWLSPKTRPWNLGTLTLTLICWFIVGLWYGMGYCPLTDWHWQVREKLGDHDLPNSFIKYIVDSVTGMDWDATLIDYATFIFFAGAFVISLVLNIRDFVRASRS